MSPSERDLDAWMARLADGDRGAFEPIFVALWPRALAVARRRLPSDAADDAAQATMTKVFFHAARFERGAAVLPWFYAIAANEVRAEVRRARGHDGLDAAVRVAAIDDPERLAVDRELRAALDRAIEDLDADSAEAIAAVLGDVPRPAVGSAAFRKRVSRAYARLRTRMGSR